MELVHAAWIHERILAGPRERRFQVSDVAVIVAECAEKLRPQPQVQRQVGPHLPVILRKQSRVVLAVGVAEQAASTEAEVRLSQQELLEVGERPFTDKEQLSIERLREQLVEVYARELTAKAQRVLPPCPAQGFHKIVVVLDLELVSLRRL